MGKCQKVIYTRWGDFLYVWAKMTCNIFLEWFVNCYIIRDETNPIFLLSFTTMFSLLLFLKALISIQQQIEVLWNFNHHHKNVIDPLYLEQIHILQYNHRSGSISNKSQQHMYVVLDHLVIHILKYHPFPLQNLLCTWDFSILIHYDSTQIKIHIWYLS